LDREEARAKDRIAELETRVVQFTADMERERKLGADAEAAIAKLAEEEKTLRKDAHESASRRSGIDKRVEAANSELAAADKVFGELTTQLADLAARRNSFENTIREQDERIARHGEELAAIARELASMQAGDAPAAAEGAHAALSEIEAAAIAAEAAYNAARNELDAARAAADAAEKRVQQLETEAKTLAKVLALETRNLWPPVIDHISVEKGYEKALGAALGDDLDAPTDDSAPMRWMGIAPDASDPALISIRIRSGRCL